MDRRELLKIGLTAPSLILLASCGTASDSSSSENETVEIVADYPYYESSADAVEASTLIVTGKAQTSRFDVNKPISTDDDDPEVNPQEGAESVDESDLETPITVTGFKVEEVVHGKSAKSGDEIEVAQAGGEMDGVEYVEQGAVYLSGIKNDTVLLFLSRDEEIGGPYYLINSQQAMFQTSGGDVQPLEGTEGIDGLESKEQLAD